MCVDNYYHCFDVINGVINLKFGVINYESVFNINGYENDFSKERLHHEIYLSDARKVEPAKWKTVIRHPIKKAKTITTKYNGM